MSLPRQSLDILIVEDEAILAMDIEAMVEDAGHHVVAAAASLFEVEALDEKLHLDLAFVDIQLAKGTNGIDVCRLLRRRSLDVVIVFVTANPLKIPLDYAGAQGVIAKPFSRNGLASAMLYIEQGICSPPPSLPQPTSFIASPDFRALWN